MEQAEFFKKQQFWKGWVLCETVK